MQSFKNIDTRITDMNESLFAQLVLESETRKKEVTSYTHKRYNYNQLKSVPKEYFVGISGLRGIGKTVLLLQLANEIENSIYIAADASYLRQDNLYDILKYAKNKWHTTVFIDEIHYKENWQQDLKTIYDEGGIRVIFSGSSVIEIKKGADLSRRALIFNLKPLSFREYLVIKKGINGLERISVADLFDAKTRKEYITKYAKTSDYLQEYYAQGGILYPSSDTVYFHKALENTLQKIIHGDLEYLRSMDIKIENDIIKILERIAISPVGETNYSKLAGTISLSKPTLIKIINDLTKIGLIKCIMPCGKAAIRKKPKLYLSFPYREYFNTILLSKPDMGSLREEFFVNHVEDICYLKGKRGEKTPDFIFADKKVEIGGEGKGFYQNPDFIIRDGISFEDKIIPLFLIGFLY